MSRELYFTPSNNSLISTPSAGAVSDFATGIIVAHNHPSGDPNPSKQGIATTQQLIAAGQILGVILIDHVIVARREYYSFQAEGMIIN